MHDDRALLGRMGKSIEKEPSRKRMNGSHRENRSRGLPALRRVAKKAGKNTLTPVLTTADRPTVIIGKTFRTAPERKTFAGLIQIREDASQKLSRKWLLDRDYLAFGS